MNRVLVLNADFLPFDVVSWQRGLVMTLDTENCSAYAVEYYSRKVKDGRGRLYPVPAVIALKEYINVDHKTAPYTKSNIYARDLYICQYCREDFRGRRELLTVDHVIPRSKWNGQTERVSTFNNVVTCCKICNSSKANKSLEEFGMVLLRHPKGITRRQAFINRIMCSINIPYEWKQYIESLS